MNEERKKYWITYWVGYGQTICSILRIITLIYLFIYSIGWFMFFILYFLSQFVIPLKFLNKKYIYYPYASIAIIQTVLGLYFTIIFFIQLS